MTRSPPQRQQRPAPPSRSANTSGTFRLVQMLFLASTTTAATTSTTTCPSSFQLSFVEDFSQHQCESLKEFHTAFQEVYKGFQSYLEIRSYTSTTRSSLNDLTLDELTSRSRAQEEDADSTSGSSSRLSGQSDEGSYQLVSATATDLQVLECLHSDYCGVVTTQHCRRHKRSSRRSSSSKAATESACDWIARQDLPGCLSGATMLCQEMQASDDLLMMI